MLVPGGRSIMCKVKDEFVVNKYRLLGLDEPVPLKSFAYYLYWSYMTGTGILSQTTI